MTKEEFNKRFESLLEDSFLERWIREKKDRLIECYSAAINLKDMPDNYSFPKDVLSVCLERISMEIGPIGCNESVKKKSKKNIKRIKQFI